MQIKKIFVAGGGLMGGGITQVCAQAGYSVVMRDLSQEILDKCLPGIRWSVGKLVEKGRVKGTVEDIMARITPTTDLNAAADADRYVHIHSDADPDPAAGSRGRPRRGRFACRPAGGPGSAVVGLRARCPRARDGGRRCGRRGVRAAAEAAAAPGASRSATTWRSTRRTWCG